MTFNDFLKTLFAPAGRRPKYERTRLTPEQLEARDNPTAYVFVEFGDNFPVIRANRVLTTTVGSVRDVAVAQLVNNIPVPNTVIQGPRLTNANNAPVLPTDPTDLYADATAVRFTRFNNTAAQRAQMMTTARGVFAGLDVTVVELTATAQTLADGRVVSGAGSMAAVVATLRGNNTTSKDVYVLVARPSIGASNDNPNTFATNGYGGIAPGRTVLGELADLDTAFNRHDDLVLNFRNDANTIVHEAGHALGLQHAVTTRAPAGSAINNAIHTSEVMSYLSGETSLFFSRYPMVRGDGNTDPNTGTNPPTPPLLNSNDLAARQGVQTPFDQLVGDPNVGQNPNLRFVSGTGAHDIITITRRDANFATVTVQAFANADYTSPIIVPGATTATSTFTYPQSLDRPFLIAGGLGNDRIILAGNLGVRVTIDGMEGTDTLILKNSSLLTSAYDLAEGVAVAGIGRQVMTVIHSNLEGLTVEANRLDTVDIRGVRPETPVTVDAAKTVAIAYPGVRGDVNIIGRGRTDLAVTDTSTTPSRFQIQSNVLFATAGGSVREVDYVTLHSLMINGGSRGNLFDVTSTHAAPVTLKTGLGVDKVNVFETTGLLTIDGEDSRVPNAPGGFDTVDVGRNGSTQSIRGGLIVENHGAYTAVNVDNSADPIARTGIIYRPLDAQGKPGPYTTINGLTPNADIVLWTQDLNALTILAGSGNNTFRIHDTPTKNILGDVTTTLRTGIGSDFVTVNGTRGALVLDSKGGADTTLVGSDSTGLNNILGAVSLTGSQGDNSVTIRDRATYANRSFTYTATATQVKRTAAAPVNLSGVKSLLLQTGRARDTINVRGNPTAGVFSFDIQTGAGNDTVNVGGTTNLLAGIGLMTVNGETGTDTLNLNDQGSVVPTPYTFGVAEYPFFTSPDANVSHANVETTVLNGGSGDDFFLVNATAARTTTTLNGGDGNDGFILGDGPGLAGIAGRLRLDGQTGAGGGGYARVNDSVGTQARSYTWDGTSLSWGTVTVGVANLGLVQVIGGQADDAYRVSALGAIPLAIGDAKGNDRLTGPDAATRWNVTGLNAGDLGAAASFASIENLVGGNANDTFVIAAGAGLDGRIDGGAGVNTLDYSAFNGDSLPTPVSFYNAEGDFLDSAGGNHGEGNGDITFNPGRVGQAFDFTGVGDYIDLGNDPSLDLAGSTSVALWVKLDSLDHFKYLFADFAADGVTSQGSLGTTQGQTAFTWYQSYTDGTYQTLTGTTPIRLDQWFHLSVVRDDATKTVRLYVNGVQEASLSYAGRTVVALQGSKLLGGAGPLFPADSIDGQLDEVGIHNRALSPAEIQTIYAGTAQYAPAVLSANGTFSYAVNMAVAADGSIYVANSAQYSRPGIPGGIVRVDPVTGAQTAVTTDGLLHTAVAVAVEADGNLAALDYFNGLVRIDSITGAQLFVSDFRNADQGPVLTYMIGLVVESSGNYLVSDATTSGVYRVDRTTGFRTLVTSGGSLTGLYGLALEPTGQVLAINYGPGDAGSVVRVNPATGAQSVLASGFAILQSIAVASDGSIFVTDAGNYTGTPSRIYRIDPVTGARSIVFTHPPGLRYFSAIAIESNGSLVVSESAGNFGGDFNTFIVRLTPPASPTGVVVNLPLGTATGLTGGIANIQNVVGSSGDDLLVGNGGNVLTGGAGRDVLIAGASPSVLFGGDGDDLLIGGTTDYDRNPDALLAVRAAWSRQDADYATRVANLRNGTNGAPLLNATTVHGNGGGNTLTGGAGRDFFYGSLALDLFDTDPLTEDFEPVFVG